MRRQPVVRGHPIHALLSDLPAALIPTALVAALVARADDRRETRFASSGATTLATLGGLAAALAGWWDWLLMPSEHPAKRPATIHGLLNSASLALLPLALVKRSRRVEILATATAGMLVAAWIGGDLVYLLGWRVRPAEELEIVDEELRREGRSDVHERARRKVDEYERAETFLPKT